MRGGMDVRKRMGGGMSGEVWSEGVRKTISSTRCSCPMSICALEAKVHRTSCPLHGIFNSDTATAVTVYEKYCRSCASQTCAVIVETAEAESIKNARKCTGDER
jgi:hypothetical protein